MIRRLSVGRMLNTFIRGDKDRLWEHSNIRNDWFEYSIWSKETVYAVNGLRLLNHD